MKKLLIYIVFFLLIFPKTSWGQTKSPTSGAVSGRTLDEIKNKVASRVAELNLVEKKGVVGTVESISDTQIIIKTISDKRRIIDVDEFSEFSSPNDVSFGISDIKQDDLISILGLYNKDSERLLARFINEVTIPIFLNGAISEIDEEEFTLTLITHQNIEYIVDVERVTKTYEFVQGELEDSGFSKIDILKNAVVAGFENPKEKGRITASKIIIFPNLPKNPNIKVEAKEVPSSTPAADLE